MGNKPRIRFKGFNDDWEQYKLSDITEVIMGQSPSSKNYTDNPNDDILVQGNADLKDGKVVPRLWTKEITKTIDKGGIILTVRAPVGDVAKTDYKVVLGRGVAGIKGNDYIYQFLQKLQYNRYWVSLSSGSTFESINSNDIKDLIIDIPSIEEQTKISMLLNNVNSIITLHQCKLEKLKLTKKALLQKLFPKNGKHIPEIRFKGFTDAWEQRKLDSLGKIITGNTPSTSKKEYWSPNSDGVVWITPTDINSVKTQCSERLLTKDGASQARIVPANSILVTCIASIGKNTINTVEAAFNQQINALVPHFSNSYFILTMLNNMESAFKRVAGTSATSIINKKEFGQLSALLPEIEEQNKIGRIFELIDNNITLHQRKLERLQEVKKGLLQKMFV